MMLPSLLFVDVGVKRWLAFILYLNTSFLSVFLCFCSSHLTNMMNDAVALQRVQSNQLVSSGHAHGRINNTKASKNNLREKIHQISFDTVRNKATADLSHSYWGWQISAFTSHFWPYLNVLITVKNPDWKCSHTKEVKLKSFFRSQLTILCIRNKIILKKDFFCRLDKQYYIN